MTVEIKRRPFSCGTQWLDWSMRNCDRCIKDANCEIKDAINAAWWGDGTVSAEMAQRMGYVDPQALAWDCPEREDK